MKNRAVAHLSQRRRADSGASILSSTLPLRFHRERNTDRETPTCHAYARCYSTALQYSAEPAQQVLSTRAVVRSTTERQNYTTSQYTTRKQIYVSYIATSRKKADGSRADILPFRFGSIACETRIAKLSPVTCMRGATALCFQPLLFPHVWWRELKDTITITARFFRKRRRADRQHELLSSVSFARHGSRSSDRSRACEGATAYSAGAIRQSPRSSRERSANATQGLLTVSCMCKNIKKKKKETRPGLI